MSEEKVTVISDLEAIIKEKDARITELEAKVKAYEDTPHICKRCGRDNYTAELKVKDEVLQEYFRSLLGQRPFSYTLKALHGMLNIEFTLQQGETLVASLSNERTLDTGNNDTSIMFLMSTLSAVTIIDKERGTSKVVYSADKETLTKAVSDFNTYYDKLVKSLDAVQLSVIRQAGAVFNLLVVQLMSAVLDEDFFKGAGLD